MKSFVRQNKILQTVCLGFFLSLSFSIQVRGLDVPSLTIYTTSSFLQFGMGTFLKESFEKKYQVQIVYVDCKTSSGLINRLALEGEKTPADMVLGLEFIMLPQVKRLGLFENFALEPVAIFPDFMQRGPLVPYCYNYLAFVYNSQRTHALKNTKMSDFLQNSSGGILLQDPRFSSVGLTFLFWLESLYPTNHLDMWFQLKSKIFKITPGWGLSYFLFQRQEAAFLLSYLTTPLYEARVKNNPHIKSILFEEGHPVVIEGAGILKKSLYPELAKKLISFLRSPFIQDRMLEKNWMLPVQGICKFQGPWPKGIFLEGSDSLSQHLKVWMAVWLK